MNHELRVKALIIGLTSPASVDSYAEQHEHLYNQLGRPDDFVTEIGVKLALVDAFPDVDLWKRPDFFELIPELRDQVEAADFVETGCDWLDYFLGRWAAAGKLPDLGEVVRLVKNRDGSTDAIVTSSEALQVLTDGAAAHPELVPMLLKLGLRLDAPAYGSFPRGSKASAPLAAPAARVSVADRRAAAVAGRRARPAPVLAPVRPKFVKRGPSIPNLLASSPVAESAAAAAGVADPVVEVFRGFMVDDVAAEERDDSVIVQFDCRPLPFTGLLSIRNAMRLADSIFKTVRAMLMPGEGYAWVDGRDDPQRGSVLVLYDAQSKGAAGLLEYPGPEVGFVQAEVEQSEDGRYSATVFGFGSSAEGLPVGDNYPDMARAKFAAAHTVRALLK